MHDVSLLSYFCAEMAAKLQLSLETLKVLGVSWLDNMCFFLELQVTLKEAEARKHHVLVKS